MANKIALIPKYLNFTCGCREEYKKENKDKKQCNKHKSNKKFSFGFRLYHSTDNMEETLKRAIEERKNDRIYFKHNFLYYFRNSMVDHDDVIKNCSYCEGEYPTLYFDKNSCSYICDNCLEKLFRKVLKK